MGTATTELDAEGWLHHHGDALFRYALRHTGAQDSAEDLVQDTLLAAWYSREGFRGEAAERTWLMGIMKHKVADHVRRQMRTPAQSAGDGSEDDMESRLFRANGMWREPPGRWGGDPLDDAQCDAFMDTLAQCLDGIPDAQRESFLMRELGELDAKATSDLLGVSANNLYVLLHRARLRLRRCLERTWFGREASS